MPLCDSSETCTRAVRLWPSPADLLPDWAAGVSEVSRFSCMKYLGVSGVFDYAGLSGNSRYRPRSCCLRRVTKTAASGLHPFGALWPTPPIPPFTLGRAPHDIRRKTRGRADRYSLLVRILHSPLHAGLSRRTVNAILEQLFLLRNLVWVFHFGAAFRASSRHVISLIFC